MSTTTISNTTLGTPCARSWSEDWIAAVNAKETELNHRICGARLPDATPCTIESNHSSGRCPCHGGFDLTGAPRGNRNGVIHGLYSRRLRTCSQSCPYWRTCPIAKAAFQPTDPVDPSDPTCASESPDNPKSKIQNPKSAPAFTCPYQLTEYNIVVTDALAVAESQAHPNPMGTHAAHNVAMLQVLANAAAAHLANTPPAGVGVSSVPGSEVADAANLANPNATLAFIRLMREFRAAMRILYTPANTPLSRQKNVFTHPSPEGVMRHIERAKHDTAIDPDSLVEARIEEQPANLYAKGYLRQSIEAASQGRDVEMAEAFDNVILLDEPLAEAERDHVLASYRPAKHSVSEELAAHILGNLHLPPLPESPDNALNQSTTPPNDYQMNRQLEELLQRYLDLFRDGKIPPEAFPINTPIRAHAEQIYTGPGNRLAETTHSSSFTESS